MNKAFRTRLALLIGAIGCVAFLTLLGLLSSFNRIGSLERQLTKDQFESFRLAEQFEASLRQLNNSIFRFAAGREEARWEQFETASDALNRWIDFYDPETNPHSIVKSQRERELFRQINHDYDDYMDAAKAIKATDRLPANRAEALKELDALDAQGEKLLDLGSQLAEAHRATERAFLDDANHSLDNLRRYISIGIVILLLLIAGFGWLLYRDLVAPLRTKLVQSEQLLERQEKLATLGTLAAGIAHEIRNPLTSIKARIYTLRKHMQPSENSSKDVAVISDEILRLERIVQEVLHFARPSEPRREIERTDTLLREVHQLIDRSLLKGIVELHVEPGPELYVSMDAALIKQVVINLVRNAIEAIEGEGSVTMRARQSRCTLGGRMRDVVVLEIIDTGMGIAPEIENRLFDPFFTTKEVGTGLGLSIAARIVEKHGGLLQYQTRLGKGTTFGVILPLVAESERPANSPHNELASGAV
jgi:signal transduction histidine kinase